MRISERVRGCAIDNKTSWFINDKLVSVDNTLDKILDAGDYKVVLNHPYFHPLVASYTLKPGERIEHNLQLIPLEGEFEVNSQPKGAIVSIDGKVQGETPMRVALQGGQFNVMLTKPGYDAIEDKIEIKTNALAPSRDYLLALKSAGVRVSISPLGGKLTLNGINVNATSKIKIKPGNKYTLNYQKPGYFSQSESFTLAPEEVRRYDFNLEQEIGIVEVTSNIPADVYINGEKAVKTTLKTKLNALEQRIEVRLPGYRSAFKTIKPTAKSTTSFNAQLITEKQARLAEAPAVYKTKAGDIMVLFRTSDRVKMGAQRSEAGQRANEFVRTAHINKPFYAGRYEVTNASYARFNARHSGPAAEPVSNISWYDAARYANWLSKAEKLQVVYELNGDRLLKVNSNADGYRLLTEAEWEWLARKSNRKNETLFTWGNTKTLPKKAANIADESAKGSVPIFIPRYDDGFANKSAVGSMLKENSGLFDMAGNVSEWTHDSYDLIPPLKGQITPHKLDMDLTRSRVIKGANWRSGTLTELRASYREGMEQSSPTVGFRLGRFLGGGN
jgi:formylglycine-generating enzyme required for sulfatase activity